MRIFQVANQVGKLLKKRARRASIGARRAHVEFKHTDEDELSRLAQNIQTLAKELKYADWVEVNAHTGRVVFAYEQNAYGYEELVGLVEQAERLANLSAGGFAERPPHPADVEHGARRLVELLADSAGLVVGLGLRLTPLPAVPGIGNLVAVLSLLRSVPKLRQALDDRWGAERAEFLLNLANSAVQGAAQRPYNSLVDVLHKYALLKELDAQRQTWALRADELLATPTPEATVVGLGQSVARPTPLPRGPIEEYADRAWAVSLSGFALSFITTRSIQRATAALFGGLPRPARVGRDVFASELSRVFAARGILVMDGDVMRRLDRVDCLVVQADLVTGDQFVIAGVLTDDPDEASSARERSSQMFDAERPLATQLDGLWKLCPWRMSDASRDISLLAHAEERLRAGALLLSLERAGRAVAVVEIEILARAGVDELISSAHEAQMRVVIAASDESVLDLVNADDVIPAQEGVRAGIRRLQREGHAVAVVATGNSPALPVADCAIGICRSGEPTPWGSHIICRRDLADVRFVIHSCRTARALSKQAVNLALAAASVGALVSAGGILPMTTKRVLFVVNTACLISMANGYRLSTDLRRLNLPEPRDPTPWHALDAEGVLARLGSGLDGLPRSEIARRGEPLAVGQSELGKLAEAVSDELFNPFAPLLAAGAGLSAVVGSVGDATMVAFVVVGNALVGGIQRYRTERKIQGLVQTEVPIARVRRSGSDLVVTAHDLVSGDLIALSPGDIVPADCRIVDAHSVEVDNSNLTGESLPVSKSVAPSFEPHVADRNSMLYEGTSIAAGKALAVVVATGDATESRRGAAVAKSGRAKGGVERRLRSLMDLTGPIALAAGVGVVGGGLLRGRSFDELVGSGVSLAVASVPEGLPLLATAAQLAAAQRLAARGALVRNGRSIEALGRVDVICLDKTGTVTEGRVELRSVSDGELHEYVEGVTRLRRNTLAAALRASVQPSPNCPADPTDEALWKASAVAVIGPDFGTRDWRPTSEISYEAGRSYHATVGQTEEGPLLSVKGAPEVILPMCTTWKRGVASRSIDGDLRYSLAVQATRLARRGLRVLAVAERSLPNDASGAAPEQLEEMHFMGFLAFTDPVRPTARGAIAGLAQAGVATVMMTGDHPSTAEAVATELELLDQRRILSGSELAELDDLELDRILSTVAVFARVTPSQKVRVVRALQRAGRVVAMVGDGSNDAPAIRLADVGVAIGEQSTAAARGAADIVLADGRVETLVRAVAEGRAMWSSVRDAVSILMGGNLGEIGFTTAAGLISGRPPLTPRQLLLVNLLTDVAPAMAIALRPPTEEALSDLANQGPEASLGQPLNRAIAVRATVTAVGAGAAWSVARITGSRARARTVALAALVGTQLGQTLSAGQGDATVRATGIGSAALLAAIIQTPGVSHFFGCRPLGPIGWATAITASAAATGLPALSSWLVDAMRERARHQYDDDAQRLPSPRSLLLTSGAATASS